MQCLAVGSISCGVFDLDIGVATVGNRAGDCSARSGSTRPSLRGRLRWRVELGDDSPALSSSLVLASFWKLKHANKSFKKGWQRDLRMACQLLDHRTPVNPTTKFDRNTLKLGHSHRMLELFLFKKNLKWPQDYILKRHNYTHSSITRMWKIKSVCEIVIFKSTAKNKYSTWKRHIKHRSQIGRKKWRH